MKRYIDKLGRITIPKDLREKFGLDEGTEISLSQSGDKIVISKNDAKCVICKSKTLADREIKVCEKCFIKLKEFYSI